MYAADFQMILGRRCHDSKLRDGSVAATERVTLWPTCDPECDFHGMFPKIDGFPGPLRKILLPQDRLQWPKPEFIQRANAFRLIA
jgi:hypothetical protein